MPSDLTPTTDRPGIHIAAPDHGTPHAAYACRCGRLRTARGTAKVVALVQDWEHHRPQCSPAPLAPRVPATRTNPTNGKRTTAPAADDGGLF
ncbi:hypothetical protein [Streptomyces rubiginosohelvolus]|uniref:hypothetical protein n=1 Tax=Streptomyces rubiginosohelvolus TaxID=67362 RepID=UPI0035DF541C